MFRGGDMMTNWLIILFTGILLGAYMIYRYVNKKIKCEVTILDEYRKYQNKKVR
jgi:hypothetical protein